MDKNNNEKAVTAALLTRINLGERSFTAEELDEELPVRRDAIEQTLTDLKGEGLLSVSGEGVYTIAADIADFRDHYLNIGRQVSVPASKAELSSIRIPARVAKVCGFGQRRSNRRIPPVVDVDDLDDGFGDDPDWLKDIDSDNFDDLFESVFGDDEE